MGGDKKSDSPVTNPFAWAFRASALLLGTVITLNMAVAFLRPILPWLLSGVALTAITWIAIAVWRWKRSRW